MFESRLKLDIVDFHSHILPCADHGSSSVETSLKQLKHASDRGIRRIIATPHFYPMNDSVESFLARRAESYEQLKEHLSEDLPIVILGAEVMMCTGIERLPGLEKLFVNGTRTLLMEFPHVGFQSEYADSVYRLVTEGIDVVIAHPERYDIDGVEAVLDSGARLQCNAHTLAKGRNNKNIRQWISDKQIVAIGSDIHQHDFAAYHSFVKAIASLREYAEYIKEFSDAVWNEADKNS